MKIAQTGNSGNSGKFSEDTDRVQDAVERLSSLVMISNTKYRWCLKKYFVPKIVDMGGFSTIYFPGTTAQ